MCNTLDLQNLLNTYRSNVPVVNQSEVSRRMGHQSEETPDATPLGDHIQPNGTRGGNRLPGCGSLAALNGGTQGLLDELSLRVSDAGMLSGTIEHKELPGDEPESAHDSADIVDPLPPCPIDDVAEDRIEQGHAHRTAQVSTDKLAALVGRNPFGSEHVHRWPGQAL